MYHYLDSSSKPQGPFTLDQLLHLEAKGVITSQTLVASVGDSQWRSWREVLGASPTTSADRVPRQQVADGNSDTTMLGSLNKRLESIVMGLYERWPAAGAAVRPEFDRFLGFLNHVLQMGILVAGALAAILLIVAAVKLDSTYLVLFGLATIPAFFVFQYVVSLFATANIRLLNGPTITLFTMVLPKAFVVVATVASILLGLGGGVLTIMAFAKSLSGGLSMLGVWLGTIFVGVFACWIAARCSEALNVRAIATSEQNAADYFANLVRLLCRFLLALTPLIGALASVSMIFLLLSIGGQLLTNEGQDLKLQFVGGAIFATAGFTLGMVFLLPLIAHFVYISIVTISEIVTAFFRMVHDNGRMAADIADSESGSPK